MVSLQLLCIPIISRFGLLSAHTYTIQIAQDCKTHAKQDYSFSMAPKSLDFYVLKYGEQHHVRELGSSYLLSNK